MIIDEGHYIVTNYPFQIKPKFSRLGSIIEILTEELIINFVFDVSIRYLLGFKEDKIWRKYNLSPNHNDVSSFDNFFLECDIDKGMTYKQKTKWNNPKMDNDGQSGLQIC